MTLTKVTPRFLMLASVVVNLQGACCTWAENGERWISVSNPPPLPPVRTVSLAPAGAKTPNNGTAFHFKLLFADHAAELWPQISFDVRKSRALFIDHFSLSNMRPLIDQCFKCSACDLMFVNLWLFVTRDKADAWATNTALVNR